VLLLQISQTENCNRKGDKNIISCRIASMKATVKILQTFPVTVM
jgi:hypothetical protein